MEELSYFCSLSYFKREDSGKSQETSRNILCYSDLAEIAQV